MYNFKNMFVPLIIVKNFSLSPGNPPPPPPIDHQHAKNVDLYKY